MTVAYVGEYVLPDIALQEEPSYKTALVGTLEADEYDMGIYFLNQRIGTSNTHIEPRPDGGCSIVNRSEMAIPMLGKEGVLKVYMISRLDRAYHLRTVELSVDSSVIKAKVTGVVTRDSLYLTFRTPDGFNEATIPLTGKETFSNGMSPFINMPNLAVGKEWDIFMIDPLTMGTTKMRAKVESIEPFQWKGAVHDTFVVTILLAKKRFEKTRKMYRAWIDKEGRVLREEIGAGLALERD